MLCWKNHVEKLANLRYNPQQDMDAINPNGNKSIHDEENENTGLKRVKLAFKNSFDFINKSTTALRRKGLSEFAVTVADEFNKLGSLSKKFAVAITALSTAAIVGAALFSLGATIPVMAAVLAAAILAVSPMIVYAGAVAIVAAHTDDKIGRDMMKAVTEKKELDEYIKSDRDIDKLTEEVIEGRISKELKNNKEYNNLLLEKEFWAERKEAYKRMLINGSIERDAREKEDKKEVNSKNNSIRSEKIENINLDKELEIFEKELEKVGKDAENLAKIDEKFSGKITEIENKLKKVKGKAVEEVISKKAEIREKVERLANAKFTESERKVQKFMENFAAPITIISSCFFIYRKVIEIFGSIVLSLTNIKDKIEEKGPGTVFKEGGSEALEKADKVVANSILKSGNKDGVGEQNKVKSNDDIVKSLVDAG